MAFVFVKFPRKYLQSKEWLKPRKYTRAEALLYLISEPNPPSNCQLSKLFQWSKTTVAKFLAEMHEKGYIGQKMDTLVDKKWTDNINYNNELQGSGGQKMDTLVDKKWTLYKEKKNITPQVLSTTNVVSNTIPPKGEEGFLQEVSEDFRETVKTFFAYKRERQESYKTHRSMQAFYSRLKKISQDNPVIAREIIEQSMANNWAGIFPLKTTNYDKQPTVDSAGNAEPDEIYRIVAEGIARAHTPQEWESRAVGL